MKRFLIITILLISASKLSAQFSDSIYYHLNYAASGNYNRTNSNQSYLLNNTLNFNYRKKPFMIDFNNKWLYGEQQKKLINNDFSSVLDVNLYKSLKHFYYWALAVYNKSYSLRINNQLQAGGGVAYIFIDKPNFKVKITDGILYDYNDVYLGDTARVVFQTPRNSLGLNIKYYYKTRFSFTTTFFIQNSLQQRNDVIYKGEADLKIRLTRLLSLSSKLIYNKINQTKRENLFITFGLAFDTYF